MDNQDLRPHIHPVWRLFLNDFWGTPMAQESSHKSYRPLTVLTYRWNYALTALEPWTYHAVNVALHAIVVALFYRFSCGFLNSKAAFAGGVLFATHPVHVEAVTGVVGRAELLSGIFFLLAILCYLPLVYRTSTLGKGECFIYSEFVALL